MAKRKEGIKSLEDPPSRLFMSQDLIHQGAQAHGMLDEWVISLTLSGAVHYRIGEDRFITVKGDMMVMRPLAKQFWQVLGEDAGGAGHWHVVYAAFGLPSHLLGALDFPFEKEGYFRTNLLHAPVCYRRVYAAFKKARRLSTSVLPLGRELTHHTLAEALLWTRAAMHGAGEPVDPRIARALEFMNRQLHLPLALNQITAAAASSRSQLCLVFQQKLGVSPIQYLEQLRMDRARQMLKMTTHPVKHIAQAVGYEDPKYFVKRFRQAVGVTPRGYRRDVSGE
jgi:AraC-like DNA-binding protein